MQVFINETSLNSQFSNSNDFFNSLRTFLSSIKFISELKKDKHVFKSDDFFYFTGIKGTHFQSTLKSNPSMNLAFVTNLQLVNPKTWQKEQIHGADISYQYLNVEYCGTSVAEMAERQLTINEFKGFLLNFDPSHFEKNVKIEIIKEKDTKIVIDCNTDTESIKKWLSENEILDIVGEYDTSSGEAPLDSQTVLKDKRIFEKTHYPKNNGRNVYRRIGTNELWVVDSAKKHAGTKAHMEVFDEISGKHLGTSLYNQIRVDMNFKKERSINLK